MLFVLKKQDRQALSSEAKNQSNAHVPSRIFQSNTVLRLMKIQLIVEQEQ